MSFLAVLGATALGVALVAIFIFVPLGVGHLMNRNGRDKWGEGALAIVLVSVGLLLAFVLGTIVLDIAGVDTWIE